ncbi:MAG: NACHT domain-containing protein [Pseudonocardiaceae bacterium]
MLELARELLQRANTDIGHPIPVVLTLSSWALRQEPLGDWIVRELAARYKISTAQAQTWLTRDQLVPLLDGLDEVAEEHQQVCVPAINDFSAQRGTTRIVVCCRTTDYEQLRDPLRTYGTLTIQPLTRKQVEDFLARSGEPVVAVRVALAADSLLGELIQSPLLLSIAGAGLPQRPHRHGGHG